MHEGKGHAADIHHHVTDSNLEEEEEEAEVKSIVKARGGRKIVHFDVPAVETDVRSGKKAATSKKVEASPPTEQPAAKRSRATKVKAVEQETEATPPRRTTRNKRN